MTTSTGPLLELRLNRAAPPGVQIEEGIRALVHAGRLSLGARLPSTRVLAADLGVSRGVVVSAYAQLAAEGYLRLRRGSPPIVGIEGHALAPPPEEPDVPLAGARFNLRPDLPDFALFPRRDWLAASKAALGSAANIDLAYGSPLGAIRLRAELSQFLSRTRGVAATPERTAITAGSSQALQIIGSLLLDAGVAAVGVEEPGHRWRTRSIEATGLRVQGVPVDEDGLRVDELDGVDAVIVSPDHHFPSGAALSAERRRAIVEWAVSGDRLVIEHDYDGHFRYDRLHSGTLQRLAPEHVAYVGTASGVLVPTLRLGWAVVPARLVVPFSQRLFDTARAAPRIEQLTLAEFIRRGYLDRHVRRARAAYKRRRDLLLAELPWEVRGAPVGLFAHVRLPGSVDEAAFLSEARERGIVMDGVGEHALSSQPAGLPLGFAAEPEASLRPALRQLLALV